MALLEGKTPSERNKTIAAIVLGGIAFISVSYMLFGSSGKTPPSNTNKPGAKASASPGVKTPVPDKLPEAGVIEELQPIVWQGTAQPSIPEAGRNIFAYYEGPPPSAKPSPGVLPEQIPTPIPTPTPNVMVASINPVSVYARTGDFTLEVAGDKFTSAVRIEVNGAEIPTRFINAQQLSANIPAAMISFEGPRTISVRSADGQFFSNTVTLNVQAPPTPNYAFVGLLGKRSSNDTALLKDKGGSRDLLSVQRGDVLGGRFRVTSISEREVALVDTNLKIKHSLPLTTDGGSSSTPGQAQPASGFPNPNQRYTPPPQGDDDNEEP